MTSSLKLLENYNSAAISASNNKMQSRPRVHLLLPQVNVAKPKYITPTSPFENKIRLNACSSQMTTMAPASTDNPY